MARCYFGCGTLQARIAHVLLLACFITSMALLGWGISLIQPCHTKLVTCQQQQPDAATKAAVCTPDFRTCSEAGWRRIIGTFVLLIACALGSSYFCCCAQRPADAWGCCCNCCHHMKQKPPPRPVKMVPQQRPAGPMPRPFAGGYPSHVYPAMPPAAAHHPGSYPPHMAHGSFQQVQQQQQFPPQQQQQYYAAPQQQVAPGGARMASGGQCFQDPRTHQQMQQQQQQMQPQHMQQQQQQQQQQQGDEQYPAVTYVGQQPQGSYSAVRPVSGARPVPLHSAVNVPVARH